MSGPGRCALVGMIALAHSLPENPSDDWGVTIVFIANAVLFALVGGARRD